MMMSLLSKARHAPAMQCVNAASAGDGCETEGGEEKADEGREAAEVGRLAQFQAV